MNLTTEDPSTTVTELWFRDKYGEVTQWWKDATGATSGGSDDTPDAVVDDAPSGWSVWEGRRWILTEEDMAGEDGDLYRSQDCQPGSWWWEGALRPATASEVLAFFDLQDAGFALVISDQDEE